MFEKTMRSILALLLVGCPSVCGQCGVACAEEMAVVADSPAASEVACQSPCCGGRCHAQQQPAHHQPAGQQGADHGSNSSPVNRPGDCPCENAGACICDGAVMGSTTQKDRQLGIEHFYPPISAAALGEAPADVARDTFSADSPPGKATSGRDVRMLCASFLL